MINKNSVGVRGATVKISELSKLYGPVTALASVSLSIAAGEFVSLLGASGSGKSTLLKLIAGLERPSSGAIYFGAEDATALPSEKRDIGMVFQDYALFPTMNVFDNIAFPLKMRKISKLEQNERVLRIASMVGIEHLLTRKPSQLSGGQQQRVAIARAIVFDPKILLLDEPLSALDKNLREQTKVEIKALHERLGVTIIYVTHDQSEALSMSDRIVFLDHGHVVDIGRPEDLYAIPKSALLASFLGQANFLPVVIESCSEEEHLVASPWGIINIKNSRVSSDVFEKVGDSATVVVRPEHIIIAESVQLSGKRKIEAVVQQALYNGAETIYRAVCCASGLELTLRESRPGYPVYSAGDKIALEVDLSFAVLVPANKKIS